MARSPLDPADLARRIRAVPVWYHTMELMPGVVTPGEFDMRPYVGDYGLPSSLAGMTVADVGASNGFFSFHLESLGAARVDAVELNSIVDHDVHLRDPVGAIESLRAALKPGGTLVLGCSCAEKQSDVSYAIFEGNLEWVMAAGWPAP